MSIRKLAALDIALHGHKLIVAEFTAGVLLPLALAAFTLSRGHSIWQWGLGLYLIALGINYVPLLLFAIAFTRHSTAHTETLQELADPARSGRRYAAQSLLLLVPFVLPVAALAQRRIEKR